MNISEALSFIEKEFSDVKISPRSITIYKWSIPNHPGKTFRLSLRERKDESFEQLIIRAASEAVRRIDTGDLRDPFAVKVCGVCGSENQWSNKVTKKGKRVICHNCANPKTNVIEITSWQNQTIG